MTDNLKSNSKLIKKFIKDELKTNDFKFNFKSLQKKTKQFIETNNFESINVDDIFKELIVKDVISLIENDKVVILNKEKKKRKRSSSLDKTNELDKIDDVIEVVARNNEKITNNSNNVSNEVSKYFKDLWQNGEKYYRENYLPNEYIQNNPDNITRLFCGNLNRKVTEEQLKKCIDGITHIKWIVDKETKEFYGSTFIEMKDKYAAITAVLQDKTKFMGRPLKIYYCPPKPGDVWPPIEKTDKNVLSVIKQKKPKTIKPFNCKKLFVGNLSYEIDDDKMIEFFKDCGELVGLRWLINKDTGDFRGSGYIEFSTTEEADKAFLLDGTILLGRPVNIDWTE